MASSPSPDRTALLKAFDESRTGVRGLVESGVSSVPAIFLHPDPYASVQLALPGVSIPIVDLSLPAPAAAAAAAAAARNWGFFYLVNCHHLFAASSSNNPAQALAAVRAFNELPGPERAKHYARAPVDGGLLLLERGPVPLAVGELARHNGDREGRPGVHPGDLPRRGPRVGRAGNSRGTCRAGLLSQGLGLRATALEEASCLEGRVMVCHYYPVCPEAGRTMGIVPHTDPGVIVVLAQDGVGGLQVKHAGQDGRSQWVDVRPMPGALVINVGDLLQMMSNDEYRSVEHRVVMNTREEPRVSIALFFDPGKRGDSDLYRPLPELVSAENPAKYRDFTIPELLEAFFSLELASKFLVEHFKL